MIRLSSLIVCLLLMLAPVLRAQPATGPTADIPYAVLVTIGPGDAIWEKYGHNMLWVRDPARGIDVCYNWGLFDFEQPNFLGNFVLGRMTYTMDGYPPELTFPEYAASGRRSLMQRLDLTPEQVGRLIDLCEQNRRPENKDYTYDYYRDNCSTRVRDMIDRASDGRLRTLAEAKGPTGLTYRDHSLRLMRNDWLLMTGIDFALGPMGDRPLTTWESFFVPMELEPVVAQMTVLQRTPWDSNRPIEPQVTPRRWPQLTLVGIGLAAGIVAMSRWRRANLLAVWTWWSLGAIATVFLMFMWGVTDHGATARNENLWHFSPLMLIGLALLIARRWGWIRWAAVGVVAISVLGAGLRASGVLTQENAAFIGLALPIHIAVLWAVTRLTAARPVDEVAVTS